MKFVAPAVVDVPRDDRLGEALALLVRQGLDQQGRVCLRLQGDSMWPTMPDGSLVEVERASPREIRLGDVVIWQDQGRLVAHRVVQKVGGRPICQLVTKGDNCSSSDQALPAEAVLGRVSRVAGEDAVLARGSLRYDLGAAFWILRWHVRRIPDRVGRRLPERWGIPLRRWRDHLGQHLSRGFRVLWLRR
jgi:signal peptidase I